MVIEVCENELSTILEAQKFYDPQIESIAAALRKFCDIGYEKRRLSIDDIFKIADALDVDLYEVDQDKLPNDKVHGMLVRANTLKKNDSCKIFVSKELDEAKTIFVICHELGHLIKEHDSLSAHEDFYTFKNLRRHIKGEHEANYFAGALLIHEKYYLQTCRDKNYNFDSIAKAYGVSYETATHRFANLSDMVRHFLKVNECGEVLKKANKTSKNIDWPIMKEVCDCWGAKKAHEYDIGNIYSQISILQDCLGNDIDSFFCFSKLVKKRHGKQTITLGFGLEDAMAIPQFYSNENVVKKICTLNDKSCCEINKINS